jgi:hypothetical protein
LKVHFFGGFTLNVDKYVSEISWIKECVTEDGREINLNKKQMFK